MSDTSPDKATPVPEPGASPTGTGRRASDSSAWRRSMVALVVALVALALAAGQWYEARLLRQDVATRIEEAGTQTRESRLVAEQVRESMAQAQAKLGVLESRIAESQKQQIALEALYQELSRNRDEWAYAEIEQSLLTATYLLRLAGNVKAAVNALQTADARLQRLGRPQLTPLRKAINRDIERLKAMPQVDTVAIGARLEGLAGQVDGLPLAMDMRPQPTAAANGPEQRAWTRFWRDTWGELQQLVRVQRMDRPDIALLAPSQAFFLRENLKLRLTSARLALLARDGASYKADLKAARAWLGRYYDTSHNGVAQALAVLQSLQGAEIAVEPPEISASLEAMHNLRVASDRGKR